MNTNLSKKDCDSFKKASQSFLKDYTMVFLKLDKTGDIFGYGRFPGSYGTYGAGWMGVLICPVPRGRSLSGIYTNGRGEEYPCRNLF